MISGQEPGPLWEHFDYAQVRYKFCYAHSNSRSILIRTQNGRELTGSVEPSYLSDLAEIGLDEAGVISKFKRLADIGLQSEVLHLLTEDHSSDADEPPAGFFRYVKQSMLKALS